MSLGAGRSLLIQQCVTTAYVSLLGSAELARGRVDVSEGIPADVVVERESLESMSTRFCHLDPKDDHDPGFGHNGESAQRVTIPWHSEAGEETDGRPPRR